MIVDETYFNRMLFNLSVELTALIERLEKALTPKPRGPTPCTTCRWFMAANEIQIRPFCAARQDDGQAAGAALWEAMLPIGCPQHEPLPAPPASVEGPADRDAAGGQ